VRHENTSSRGELLTSIENYNIAKNPELISGRGRFENFGFDCVAGEVHFSENHVLCVGERFTNSSQSHFSNPRDFETELFRLGPTIVTEFFISKFPILLVNHFFTSQKILDFSNVAIGSTSTELECAEIVKLNSLFRGDDFGNGKMLVVDSGSTTSRVLGRVENEGSHFGFLGVLFGSPYTMKILDYGEKRKTNFSSNLKGWMGKRKLEYFIQFRLFKNYNSG